MSQENIVENVNEENKTNSIAWILFITLFFLRFPIVAFFSEIKWVMIFFDVGTYFLTACLIWWERENLKDFHIDKLSLFLIILFKPIQTLILTKRSFLDHHLMFPKPLSLVIWGIAIALLLSLYLSLSKLPKFQFKSIKWLGVGIIAGLATSIFLGFFKSFQIDLNQFAFFPETTFLIKQAGLDFFYQLGYAAVIEEPLFRGFLWGYLHRLKWKDGWILIFQTVMFSLSHIYYIKVAPISFWITVPIAALVMGLLVWRSRSIATSMAAHGALNATTRTISILFAFYR